MEFNNLTNKTSSEIIDLYFDYIGSSNFLRALEEFSNGNGFGILDVGCDFAHNFNEWDEGYFGNSGIQIIFSEPLVEKDIEIIISENEFLEGVYRAILRLDINISKCDHFITVIKDNLK